MSGTRGGTRGPHRAQEAWPVPAMATHEGNAAAALSSTTHVNRHSAPNDRSMCLLADQVCRRCLGGCRAREGSTTRARSIASTKAVARPTSGGTASHTAAVHAPWARHNSRPLRRSLTATVRNTAAPSDPLAAHLAAARHATRRGVPAGALDRAQSLRVGQLASVGEVGACSILGCWQVCARWQLWPQWALAACRAVASARPWRGERGLRDRLGHGHAQGVPNGALAGARALREAPAWWKAHQCG